MSHSRRHHFLRKLLFRELRGEFRECKSKLQEKLFHQLPNRLVFPLSLIAPASAFNSGHVFLGFTKCGQFILSYTHSCDTDDLTLRTIHRYRLHWWLFTPYQRLKKVAEVMLFGDQVFQDALYENVYISVCQWPHDISKILVYGYSLEGGDGGTGPQTRKVYITVTAVPSLDNCSACYQVATSYEEEDLAERWDSCARFSCLKHGITVHTSFEMVPPFPGFMPTVQMKMEGHVVLNAGNFIHVFSVHLENTEKHKKGNYCYDISSRSKSVLSLTPEEESEYNNENCKNLVDQDECNSDEPTVISVNNSTDDEGNCDNLKISLRDQRKPKDKDKEWEILIGNVPKYNEKTVSTRKLPIDYFCKASIQDCDIKSTDSDCSSNAGDIGKNRFVNISNHSYRSPQINIPDDTYVTDSDDSLSYKIPEGPLISKYEKHLRERFSKSNLCSYINCEESQIKECNCYMKNHHSLDESTTNVKSKQAEKEYEFIDEITETRHEKLSVFRRRRLAEKKYEFSDENSENIPQNYRSFRSQSRRIILSPSRSPRLRAINVPFSELSVELGEPSGIFRSVYEKLVSPSSGNASPSDVLKPINQNINSPVLSPRDEKWRDDIDKMEKNDMQTWSSRESLCLHSPLSYSQKHCETSYSNAHLGGITPGPQKLNCVVDIKRRYIEVEDELVSIITDIEDDDLSTATGYHNALSLEVHGSGYSQMHMISNAKAEKLMAPGVLVRQVSLDVEQFCHETAQRLCNEAGKKYYFCNDYNVEIVDVCPSSGSVIALASVLVQAGLPKAKSGLSKSFRTPIVHPPPPSRRLYKANATFVFNMDSKTYYLLDKEPLVEEDPYSLDSDKEMNIASESTEEERWWDKSRIIAKELRSQWAIPLDYYSSIKVLTNESVFKGSSLAFIMERHHLVAVILGNES